MPFDPRDPRTSGDYADVVLLKRAAMATAAVITLMIAPAIYDAAGPQTCVLEDHVSISGKWAEYRICTGDRLGLTRDERFVRYHEGN